MARGFLSGAIVGLVVSGVGGGIASVLSGPVMSPAPQAPDAAAATAMPPEAPAADAPPSTRPTAPERQASSISPGLPDEPETSGAPALETAPAPVPQASESADAPAAPAAPDSSAVALGEEAPVLPNPQALQPQAPPAEDLSISTNPAQPLAPAETPATPDTPAAPVPAEAAEASQASDRGPDQGLGQGLGQDDDPAGQDRLTGDGRIADGQAEDAPIKDGPSQDDNAVETAQTDTDIAPDPLDASPAAEEDIPVREPRLPTITAEDDAAGAAQNDAGPSIGRGASDFSQLNPDVSTGRLPSVSDDPAGAELRPIEAFREVPDTAPDKPLMSIVLIDNGTTPLGLEALDAFPYPLSFAVDTAWSGAREAAARYRAAGFEVMALTDLPEGAQPSDVEVALQGALSVVPEAVALLEGDGTGLQENRATSDQVARSLARSGHGLVLYPKGLNTAASLAQRGGVPAQTLFRDFDSKGQDATVIRRFLDQAAFKAGQEGAVIMLGRLRADTISALLIWGLQDRAQRVSLVPVTSVLLRDGEGS